jgi:hypothetical protein
VLILTAATALALQLHTLDVLAQFGTSLNIEYNITGAVRPYAARICITGV